jgi:hypothetical protein
LTLKRLPCFLKHLGYTIFRVLCFLALLFFTRKTAACKKLFNNAIDNGESGHIAQR